MEKVNLIGSVFLSILLVFSSCNKNTTNSDNNTAFQDDAYAEMIFENISNISDEAYLIGSNKLKTTDFDRLFLGDCALVSLDTLANPHALIIDFGSDNCLCKDGKYRRGKIILSFTGRYRQVGTVISHSFDEYYVNDNKVDGTKVVTNMGINELGHMYFHVSIIGIIYKSNEGGTISWNTQREREWLEGIETLTLRDDVYSITGIASGKRANGNSWEKEIILPLRRELNCKYFVSGTMEIRLENRPVRLVDFGDEECDNIATVTVNGKTYEIILP